MSLSFTDLLTEVYNLTNRPDLVNESTTAIKAALLKAHISDFFYKDLLESAIQFSSSDYYQQFNPKDLFPRYRSLKYIRKYDNVGGAAGNFLTVIEPEKVLDIYKQERLDIFYVAGATVQIRTREQQQYFLTGMYLYPDLTLVNPSWIADEHTYAVVYEAARVLFKTIGYDEQSRAYDALVQEQMALLKISGLTPVGY